MGPSGKAVRKTRHRTGIQLATVSDGLALMSAIVPIRTKRALRAMHRNVSLRSSIRTAKSLMKRGAQLPESLLRRMEYGWGNAGWSARVNLLQALLNEKYRADTDVLECGSGLTSVLLSIINMQIGIRFVALEHDPRWHSLVCGRLASLGLPASSIQFAPLRQYGGYDWYDTTALKIENRKFNLILCDGPPSDTRGGRYGMLPSLIDKINPGTRIIVDDIGRADEINMISRWKEAYPGLLTLTAQEETYAIFTVT
jgi:hypothetical protein